MGSYFYVDFGYDGSEGEGKVRNVRTRMFGSREDPATGSAASALCSYLSLQVGRTGRFQYRVTQGVEMGRKSEIFIEVVVGGDGEERKVEEVLLSGSAVLNLEGTLVVPEEKGGE